MTDAPATRSPLRADIQALRGIAVIAVILFHAGLGLAPSGYLGVDMFFVVSGYLICGIIMREIGEGRFSFQGFYLRRVRRLLPAAYVVLAATLAAAWFLTTAPAFEHFWQQFIGTLTFSTNIVLWRQINYFNTGAAFEPLLHMWSLAVEEQFYLVLPLALLVIPRRFWLASILLATAGSLAAYCFLYPRSPGVAFYLLPTRAWELGLGALAIFAARTPRVAAVARTLTPIAGATTIAICFVPGGWSAAHLLAIPACLAVAVVIVGNRESSASAPFLRPLVAAGDMSYSLYLCHWPLFAFAHTVYMRSELPVAVSLSLVAATVVLAWALYRFVENPIRRTTAPPQMIWSVAIAASIALAGACTLALQMKRNAMPEIDLAPVRGLENPFCTGEGTAIDARCSQGANPTMLIWGDSLSQAITPAIDVGTDRVIVQASKGHCAPLPGIAPVDGDSLPVFAAGCLDFSASVLDYVARTPSIEVVVLTGNYGRLLSRGTRAMRRDASGTQAIGDSGADAIVEAQARLVQALHSLGRKVVVVSPAPQASFDIGACWTRERGGLPRIMAAGPSAPPCAIAGDGRVATAGAVARLMDAFEQRADTPVIRLDRLMCGDGICPTAWGGTPLYVDSVHLSRTGAKLVGERFDLAGLAERTAR